MGAVSQLDRAKQTVLRELQDVLGLALDPSLTGDATSLAAIGMDSLLVIMVLVTLSETCGADLSDYEDTLDPPQSIGDLVALTARFMTDGS